MPEIFKMIEKILINPTIINKKQVLSILNSKYPLLSTQQRNQCVEVAIDIYKKHLEILMKAAPGRGY